VAGDKLAKLYAGMSAPLIRTSIETAEMVKYADNVWHALKVGFANEIGNLCKALQIDSHKVMEIFCQDTKLNLSPYYLKPGFAFGGSCLPKDVRALTYKGKSLDVQLPILNAILPSNQLQVQRGVDMVLAKGRRRVGVLGFSFKAGTDDLRESPVVEVIEMLLGKGVELRIYDKNVNMAALTGANRDYILNHIPHISRIMVASAAEVMDFAEVVVVGNRCCRVSRTGGRAPTSSRWWWTWCASSTRRVSKAVYDGICWWERWGLDKEDGLRIDLANSFPIDVNGRDLVPVTSNFRKVNIDVASLRPDDYRQYDLVFSNSMLEHLTSRDLQHSVAQAILASGRPFFIQVPNKYSLIDPHFAHPLAPFFAAWPRSLQARALALSALGSGSKASSVEHAERRLAYYNPVSKSDLLKLFSAASPTLEVERTFGVPMSIVVWRTPSAAKAG
jgi:hypothetical protein